MKMPVNPSVFALTVALSSLCSVGTVSAQGLPGGSTAKIVNCATVAECKSVALDESARADIATGAAIAAQRELDAANVTPDQKLLQLAATRVEAVREVESSRDRVVGQVNAAGTAATAAISGAREQAVRQVSTGLRDINAASQDGVQAVNDAKASISNDKESALKDLAEETAEGVRTLGETQQQLVEGAEKKIDEKQNAVVRELDTVGKGFREMRLALERNLDSLYQNLSYLAYVIAFLGVLLLLVVGAYWLDRSRIWKAINLLTGRVDAIEEWRQTSERASEILSDDKDGVLPFPTHEARSKSGRMKRAGGR